MAGNPGNPYADKDGFIALPNINLSNELLELYDTWREYYLAESLLERCLPDNFVPAASIPMMRTNTEHFRNVEDTQNRLDRIERKMDALTPAS